MLPTRLTDRKRLNVVGLNSGTSADGLDLAAMAIDRRRISFIAGTKRKFPSELRRMIHRIADGKNVALDELVYLDNYLGDFIGRAAAGFIKRLAGKGTTVHLIASHGQTVRHLPTGGNYLGRLFRGSLQIGSLDMIAARTGLPVVGDFRQADIAAGGEGAPITTAAMGRLFSSKTEPRLIVNIGGMSNFFYFPESPGGKIKLKAADCGPGNALLDLLAQMLFDQPFDRGGRLAERGKLSQRLLALLLGQSFYSARERSTGREQFGLELARTIVNQGKRLKLSRYDIMRTAAELTTLSIASAVWPLVKKDLFLDKLYLTGGGRNNRFFVKRLQYHLPDLQVEKIDSLGIDGDLVEAACFALLGESCLRSEPTRLPGGPTRSPVLGHFVQPPSETGSRKRK
ncbi:MAG TPA: anhydro-N-acetylmuramic acid kinase [candidate division Zixibacteria bacterium]|nr:anhydro-N-acetylmuramic acid kinase [candidate division Zixibacteria bacterium]